MNAKQYLETNQAEALKQVAESLYPQFPCTIDDEGYVLIWLTYTCYIIFEPRTDKAQSWDLMQAYKGELFTSFGMYSTHCDTFERATKSPEALLVAYMSLKDIKGE